MMSNKRTYKTLDSFKMICALLVVLIHTNEIHEYIPDMLVFSLTRCAVPYFFIVSGWFFQKGLSQANVQGEFLRNYVSRQLQLYFLWQLVILYPTVMSYRHLYEGRSVIFITLVILRRVLLCGGDVYWYILVLAESAIVIYFLGTVSRSELLYTVMGLGLALGLIYENRTTIALFSALPFSYVNKAFYIIFSWSNNFIMKGVPFMGIGYLCSKISPKFLKKDNSWKAAVAGLLLATGINIFLFITGRTISFMYVVQAVSIFIIGITREIGISEAASIRFRELSSCIYFIHTLIIYNVIDILFGVGWNSLLKYFTAVFLSCLVYFMLKYIIKKHDSVLLRFMFNIRRSSA